jgi:hypothetical protein
MFKQTMFAAIALLGVASPAHARIPDIPDGQWYLPLGGPGRRARKVCNTIRSLPKYRERQECRCFPR